MPRVDTLPEIQQSAINDGLAAVLAPGQPLGAYNAEFLQGHPGSAPHILGAAKGMLDVRGEAGKSDVAELVLQLTREENHASLAVSIVSVSGEMWSSRSSLADRSIPFSYT